MVKICFDFPLYNQMNANWNRHFDDSLQNHIVSSKTFVAGETVLFDTPSVYVSAYPTTLSRCDVCSAAVTNASICSSCHFFCYCSSCELPSWHSSCECELLQNLKFLPTDDGYSSLMLVRLALRVWSMSQSGHDPIEGFCSDSLILMERTEQYKGYLSLLSALGCTLSSIDLFGQLEVNCHDVPDLPNVPQSSGMAAFQTARLLTHSCVPNCSMYSDGGQLIITAVRPIKPNEVLTVSYIDNLKCVHERCSELQSRYGFTCTCEGCSSSELLPTCNLYCPSCKTCIFELHGEEFNCSNLNSNPKSVVEELKYVVEDVLACRLEVVESFYKGDLKLVTLLKFMRFCEGFKSSSNTLCKSNSLVVSLISLFMKSVIDSTIIPINRKKEFILYGLNVIEPYFQYNVGVAADVTLHYAVFTIHHSLLPKFDLDKLVETAVHYEKLHKGEKAASQLLKKFLSMF
ncbi:hypothetical protein P9112_014577 [Eukaryota sp. TZLM1-RC]